MTMRIFILSAFLITKSVLVIAQNQETKINNDGINTLMPVIIKAKLQSPERMPEIKENVLFSGKKNEVLRLSNINANLASNNPREIFARIPGVTIWEN